MSRLCWSVMSMTSNLNKTQPIPASGAFHQTSILETNIWDECTTVLGQFSSILVFTSPGMILKVPAARGPNGTERSAGCSAGSTDRVNPLKVLGSSTTLLRPCNITDWKIGGQKMLSNVFMSTFYGDCNNILRGLILWWNKVIECEMAFKFRMPR